VRAEQPHFYGIACYRGHRRDDIHGFAGDARRHQPMERDAIEREGVAPPQRVDGRDQGEWKADEEKLPPKGVGESRERLVRAHTDDEEGQDREGRDERESPKRAHASNG
jgi:hypothetical protein